MWIVFVQGLSLNYFKLEYLFVFLQVMYMDYVILVVNLRVYMYGIKGLYYVLIWSFLYCIKYI